MNVKTSTIVAAIASALSLNAHAVLNGTDVSASDYKDYVVKLVVNNSSNCGGALIGSSYLLSARHCFTSDNTADGALPNTGSLNVSQGVRSELKTTDVTYTVLVDGANAPIVNDWVTKAQNWFDTVVYPADTDMNGRTFQTSDFTSDWVLLSLSAPIPHSDSARIVPLYDTDNLVSYLPADTTVTFRGWGVTESESYPSVMQKMQLRVTTDWEKGVERVISTNTPPSSKFDSLADEYVEAVCTTSDTMGIICSYDGTDQFKSYGFSNMSFGEGDSGTPVSYNGNIVGVISSSSIIDYVGYVQHFTLAMDHITGAMNKLVYPRATRYVTIGSTSAQQFDVVVANYTNSSQLLTPTLNDSTGLFSADVTDCNTTLASGDACTIAVTFNAGGQSITSAKNAQIDLNGSDTILLSGAIATGSNEDSTGGAVGGGGGSLGFLSLVALLGYGWLRKRT